SCGRIMPSSSALLLPNVVINSVIAGFSHFAAECSDLTAIAKVNRQWAVVNIVEMVFWRDVQLNVHATLNLTTSAPMVLMVCTPRF
ncbi:MAG: hypothetical protein U0694_14200, partial [Anaerolineae bacterium]